MLLYILLSATFHTTATGHGHWAVVKYPRWSGGPMPNWAIAESPSQRIHSAVLQQRLLLLLLDSRWRDVAIIGAHTVWLAGGTTADANVPER